MELNKLKEIRKIAIIAMFSDDDLMQMLVLKGGNAISLYLEDYSRASVGQRWTPEFGQLHKV